MLLLASMLTLLFVGSSVAAAEDSAAPETFEGYAYRLLITRALVPADQLGGYEAFQLGMTQRKGDRLAEDEAQSAIHSRVFRIYGTTLVPLH